MSRHTGKNGLGHKKENKEQEPYVAEAHRQPYTERPCTGQDREFVQLPGQVNCNLPVSLHGQQSPDMIPPTQPPSVQDQQQHKTLDRPSAQDTNFGMGCS